MVCDTCAGKGQHSWQDKKTEISYKCSICNGTGSISVPWEENKESFFTWYGRQQEKCRILEGEINNLRSQLNEYRSKN